MDGRREEKRREEKVARLTNPFVTPWGRAKKTGWAKFMEWKYPVEVVITSQKTFNTAGAVEVAASL